MRTPHRHIVVVAALSLAVGAVADDDLVVEAKPLLHEGLSFRVAGYGWAPRFDGDVKVAGADIALRGDLDHGDTRWAPWGEVDLRWKFLDVRVSGYTISEDARSVATRAFAFGSAAAAPGDRVESDLSVDSLQLEARFTFYEAAEEHAHARADGSVRDPVSAGIRLGAAVGMRWIGLDHDVTVRDGAGGLLSADSRDLDWFVLYGGPQLEFTIHTRPVLPFLDHFTVGGMAGVGTPISGGGGTFFEVRAGIDLMFTPNLGLSLGYRLQNLDLDDGDYDFDGSLQGLVVGGVLRF